jgi:hypothetical protein
VLLAATAPEYRYAHQTVSEISAIGASTRPWWLASAVVHNALLMGFAWGVWQAAADRRWLRVSAVLLAILAAMGLPWAALAPMHQRGQPSSLTDTMHIAFSIVQVVLSLAAVGFAAAALGRRFRIASIGLAVAMLVGGGLSGLYGPSMAANQPTPWLGVVERVSVYGYLLWVALLAAAMWREADRGSAAPWRSARPLQEPGP